MSQGWTGCKRLFTHMSRIGGFSHTVNLVMGAGFCVLVIWVALGVLVMGL